ncbi:inositol polyphosphate-4-phosphatase type I A-like isoform X2 [Mya arenaria]|uniref:inositol polyphosphate-4-phosphatase type I A-like isoform X2 n=1 Tax=Mya arenaria TaxID=6604 RepID=UPI0022E2F243|nr:inositol polyphosphate-4-phosphatase type I A-like isoform X2 [Mya arenaria]
MRFNSKELAVLAQQDSSKFDKEGTLFMKQKNDKLFKKGEALVEKYLRLRGNLLFYFKGKEYVQKSEPQGVLVLERCAVELDVNEQNSFSFVIVFEGDEVTYTFSALTEEERDDWIQTLHDASYECLKMQLQSLREQVQARTGEDPLIQMLQPDTGMDFETRAAADTSDPAMEISLTVEGLPNDSNEQAPNPFAVVYIIVPPQQQNWLQHSHTEMVEKNNNPHFLKTIGFGDTACLETSTRVKIAIYHVKERMTGTMTMIGHVIFTLNELLLSDTMSLKFAIVGPDSSKVGTLSIVSWLNDTNDAVTDLQEHNDRFSDRPPSIRARPLSMRCRSKRLEMLKPVCDNIVTRTFRFDTNDSNKLLVHEYMADSKFTFEIPMKVLQLLISEEQRRIKELQDIGQLPRMLESYLAADISHGAAAVSEYTDNINVLACYRGRSFKASTKKSDRELEFAPLNLHLQRMIVLNEANAQFGCYDTITVGAFVAHARKFRAGGLTQLLQKLQEGYTAEGTLSKVTKVKRACQLVNTLLGLQSEIVVLCERVCQEALQGDSDSLQAATLQLEYTVKDLVQNCEKPILQETAAKLADVHEEMEALSEQSGKQEGPHSRATGSPGFGRKTTQSEAPELKWKWTGSCFIKSPTIEPWDMTRVNTEASLVCLTTMVEDLIQNKSGPMDRPKWLGEISPAVIKLKSFIEICCEKAAHFMSFLDLMEHKDNLKLMHTIKTRRDIVFSQALSSLVFGLVLHVTSLLDHPHVFPQLAGLGCLVQVEGLLSCHGEDVPLLEDMIVALDDLSTVSFKLVQETKLRREVELVAKQLKRACHYPDLSRHHVCIEIPIPKSGFDQLPSNLKSGSEIKLIPLFFNIGINEQGTLAERFGNTSLQDKANEESFGRLHNYVEEYKDKFMDKSSGANSVGSIPSLVQQLHTNVYTKKSKNVEILHLAAELCRKLHGVRITCCKSAKDRTAMAVTLEQVQILQRDHNLASHVFMQSLDCFRSEGVRRENTFKNVGLRKYAFNSLQLLSFPKQYRPPNGTYGNVQT